MSPNWTHLKGAIQPFIQKWRVDTTPPLSSQEGPDTCQPGVSPAIWGLPGGESQTVEKGVCVCLYCACVDEL